MAQGVPGRLRPQIILTFRHYKGGRSSTKHTGRLYPRRNPWYSLSEAESTSGHMVLSGVPREKSPVTPPGIDPGTVRLVAQRLNHHANPRPQYSYNNIIKATNCYMFWALLAHHQGLQQTVQNHSNSLVQLISNMSWAIRQCISYVCKIIKF